MKQNIKQTLMSLAFLSLVACQPKGEIIPALDMADLDTTVTPGTDFYQYANGGWMKRNPLKPEFSRYSSFDVLAETNEQRLNDLFKSMAELNPKAGTVEQKIVDLYKQGLDSLRQNEEGVNPIKEGLNSILSISSKAEFTKKLADLTIYGGAGFFGGYVAADLMDSNNQILYVSQGGLGLGNKDYYVDESNKELIAGYRNMLEKMFTLAGVDNASQRADNALAVENKLAAISWSQVECRDVEKGYNPMSSSDFAKLCPGFDFPAFFSEINIPEQEKMVVEQPSFFEGLSKIFTETDLSVLVDYQAATFIRDAADFLSDDFRQVSFDFYGRQLSGIAEQRPRWKRAMSVPNSILGEAVGQMYVKRYFPASSKKKALELVKNLQTALGEHISNLEWMSDSTKAYALEKLAAFTIKIGYPDKWKDYSTLDIKAENSWYANVKNANKWYTDDNLSKLGKPTDRSEWYMSPQTVNAYYNPTTNEICFPAAILQPPFFNADADDAVNYGGIGVVIGHEMTHGFDDQGRLFDKDGNMHNWWTEDDIKRFNSRTEGLVAQFDKIEVLPGVFANGKFSLGENIADQGGLRVSWTAFHNSLKGKTPEPIDGFTADQRFYLSYAHIWANNITNEEIARRTKMDVHSLGKNRVNASIMNLASFFDAFGIKEGDAMFRPESERVIIW